MTSWATVAVAHEQRAAADHRLSLEWEKEFLTISAAHIPGGPIKILYLEAFCRPGSTDRDWRETVIGHRTELLSADEDGRSLRLRSTLADGAVVTHDVTAGDDSVDFALLATNPTRVTSQAHWAQPCMRVGTFTGRGPDDYLDKCFIFLDGKLARFPCRPWAAKARYTPGQVWRGPGVDRDDVNPRPLSELTPSHGLIGCFSSDGKMLLATAWEPYQELFQGVVTCVHSDFRIGGLAPGETKKIRGKLYIMEADPDKLLARYERDFPK
ncbi:MAG: hypothetical protein HYX69_14355 [Planctomycetia bacterium]|nr:hypothetical protein [Planctomycetia bacterium]